MRLQVVRDAKGDIIATQEIDSKGGELMGTLVLEEGELVEIMDVPDDYIKDLDGFYLKNRRPLQ